ncbi:integrase [Jiangella alkaliphila]|uniref:Uncharacterized protein n=1 Tax=Jiangella alkaliphila TaxID=419479 RepID=A0A1H2I0R6_9ACTN|nr:integrase [Jiangella alkaliphila]SDU37673.1 hypothetical protein SAMN04488563_1363 [Jiangella alkaliphila]
MNDHLHGLDTLLVADAFSQHVVARLLDFFADTSPWPRRLWEVGSVLALREGAEAGTWLQSRVLSQSAVSWYLRALERQLGPDKGLGDSRLRKLLTELLRSGLAPDSRERRQLIQLIPAITDGYLDRWAAAADSAARPSPERLACAIAAHLLDLGHSSGQLHRWARAVNAEPDATLRDVFDGAVKLAARPDADYEVVVPFLSVPDHQQLASGLPEWRPPEAAATWFRENGVEAPPRHNGAFVYSLKAKDPVGAARAAGSRVQRLEARRSYARGSKKSLVPVGHVWIRGEHEPLPLNPPERGAKVLSLESEKTMYAVVHGDQLDEALELAAPLNGGPAASAVSGAWAAIESLLYHPGDEADKEQGRAVAADRLAAIVACSWPRAELTALSYRHSPTAPDELLRELGACESNRQRS